MDCASNSINLKLSVLKLHVEQMLNVLKMSDNHQHTKIVIGRIVRLREVYRHQPKLLEIINRIIREMYDIFVLQL
jgi:hypothetical protein